MLGAAGKFVLFFGLGGCSPQLVDVIEQSACEEDASSSACGGTNGASGAGGTAGSNSGGLGASSGGGGASSSALAHRYSFDGIGNAAVDSVAGEDGVVVNTLLDGSGALTLAGGSSDQYVDLPNRLLRNLLNATFEAWITWDGGPRWQRIFDFGDTILSEEGDQGTGRSYIFLAATGPSQVPRVAYNNNLPLAEVVCDGTSSIAFGVRTHLAVVVDNDGRELSLYMDGARVNVTALGDPLLVINDINNWLGRSQYNDPELAGRFHEFRIYAAALGPAEVRRSFEAGPDALP
ncbi:MAG TPA: LamG domain-containing protein [Polyangiaceae bacterium]|nr:LamG domain-containing protein [Polyangiaceae bacterium]